MTGGGDEEEAGGSEVSSPTTTETTKTTAISIRNKITLRAPQVQYTAEDFIYGQLLGLGSYSRVIRAKKKDAEEEEECALKIMDKAHIEKEDKKTSVMMERLILDQLEHPGVIRLYFTFQDKYTLYMGLELCLGGELFDQIRKKGRLSLDEARYYAAEIVDVLEHIHNEGIIHRDIKPENLLLTADGHIKLADFGSAKLLKPLPNGVFENQIGKSSTFVGTAEYVSPEVLKGRPVTIGADLWALGCVIYQMLEGRPPFKGGSEYLTFEKVLARDLSIPKHFSSDAKDLVNKLLDLDPSKRPGGGSSGYESLKNHAFFRGIDWSRIRQSPAPKLAPSQSQGGEHEEWELRNGITALDLSTSPSSLGSGTGSSPRALLVAASRLLDDDHQLWQRFVLDGETLVATSLVKKFRTLSVKRRQLILTDKPRLFYVHPKKMIVKEIPWSPDVSVRIESDSRFSIFTPKKTYHMEDSKGQALLWKQAIEKLQSSRS